MYGRQVSRDLAGIGLSAKGRAKCTARLEYVEQATESALRVVASFNREPSPEECAEVLGKTIFGGHLKIVPKSFRRVDDKTGSRVVLAGFMGAATQEMDIAELESDDNRLKEVASGSNIYHLEDDDSIWRVDKENNRLVKTMSEDLSEVMETASAHVKPGIPSKPVIALATVAEKIDGPDNTQYIAYINPKLDEAKVSFGARVDDSHVLDRATDQVVEIAQNMVIECKRMHGRDKMLAYGEGADEPVAADAGYNRDDVVEYYRKVFGYNPSWLDKFEDIINKGAWA